MQVPSLTSFQPLAGPKSGGLRLTVHGENLDVGFRRHVQAASRTCHVVRYPDDLLSGLIAVMIAFNDNKD